LHQSILLRNSPALPALHKLLYYYRISYNLRLDLFNS
jgi:hypothetical protein